MATSRLSWCPWREDGTHSSSPSLVADAVVSDLGRRNHQLGRPIVSLSGRSSRPRRKHAKKINLFFFKCWKPFGAVCARRWNLPGGRAEGGGIDRLPKPCFGARIEGRQCQPGAARLRHAAAGSGAATDVAPANSTVRRACPARVPTGLGLGLGQRARRFLEQAQELSALLPPGQTRCRSSRPASHREGRQTEGRFRGGGGDKRVSHA